MESRPAVGRDIARGIKAFMSRDWARARQRKDRHWADRIDRFGVEEAFRIADELRRHALALDPAWPHPDQRRADLEAHARLATLLERVSRARGR